ncbi:MAG: hypothetical protein O3C27_08845 [Actinomycetota bacterium]|nr:hypothetical protein [Actinomycetota bacterium]
MRRGLAGLILGLSLVLASVSWAGFVLTNTVLDPGRSERLADQLLDNEALRAALVGRLVVAMEASLPAEVPVPRQQLEQAANLALDDPRVDAMVRDGIVRTHRNALEGNPEPVVLDASALGTATRDALIGVRLELATVLPEAPPVNIELPTTGLSWLGRLRDLAQRVSTLLGLAALVGVTVSLFVAKNRPAILRRVSIWTFGASAFWLVIGYGVPFLAEAVAPSSTAIISAMIDVFFGAMIRPAVLMGAFGGLLLGASMLWATASQRRGAAVLQPARGGTPAGGGDTLRTGPGRGGSRRTFGLRRHSSRLRDQPRDQLRRRWQSRLPPHLPPPQHPAPTRPRSIPPPQPSQRPHHAGWRVWVTWRETPRKACHPADPQGGHRATLRPRPGRRPVRAR